MLEAEKKNQSNLFTQHVGEGVKKHKSKTTIPPHQASSSQTMSYLTLSHSSPRYQTYLKSQSLACDVAVGCLKKEFSVSEGRDEPSRHIYTKRKRSDESRQEKGRKHDGTEMKSMDGVVVVGC